MVVISWKWPPLLHGKRSERSSQDRNFSNHFYKEEKRPGKWQPSITIVGPTIKKSKQKITLKWYYKMSLVSNQLLCLCSWCPGDRLTAGCWGLFLLRSCVSNVSFQAHCWGSFPESKPDYRNSTTLTRFETLLLESEQPSPQEKIADVKWTTVLMVHCIKKEREKKKEISKLSLMMWLSVFGDSGLRPLSVCELEGRSAELADGLALPW